MKSYLKTPIGWLRLECNGKRITAIKFSAIPQSSFNKTDSVVIRRAKKQIVEYFEGTRKGFTVPVDLGNATVFQKAVWNGLRQIDYGKTLSYTQLSKRIGHPGAQRAVGSALGKNPIGVILPCHRVVATKGLGGFAGGLTRKKKLLDHEGLNDGAW